MTRYWKLVGVVLAIAVLAVVMVAAVPAAKPGPEGGGAQLFTLIDGESIEVGETFDSDYLQETGKDLISSVNRHLKREV